MIRTSAPIFMFVTIQSKDCHVGARLRQPQSMTQLGLAQTIHLRNNEPGIESGLTAL